ncbi:electron transfer flavoprotein subunit beta/FixA family protein [Collimonas sp.]|jgi:electron transfer flavoprotein beta subunit|uniref:electron transfer flavoprotein subunit beta/FixA family protein n=1 Tax=Collimonas sp. TaxID=1963772 RepID=UPI002C02C78F|nr:electron transfer flavoprotein subunit beta/FixA family protein [Collimonas sp.]HWW08512.1 electron transfer flavoprotein subunit beta/FixA family protein [Collimonas sp.]
MNPSVIRAVNRAADQAVNQAAIKRIAVLVSIGRHPVSGVPRYSRNDAAALGMASELAQRTAGVCVDVIHVAYTGHDDHAALSATLSEYLALGAACITLIETSSWQDILPALQAQLPAYDLVLCGSRAEGGVGSGMLPYLLAARLNLPLLAGVISVRPDQDAVVAQQYLPKGRRREVAFKLPALMTVHPLAPSRLRYAYARLRRGEIKKQTFAAAAASVCDRAEEWTVEAAKAVPRKLVAPEKRSGHARMQAATVTESRGGKVVQDGSAADKAQVVLAYLREHHLVDY